MKTNKKVLIGYDGSAGADALLVDLQRAGLPRKTSVMVVCVADVFQPPSTCNEVSYGAAVIEAVRKGWEHANEVVGQCKSTAASAAKKIRTSFPEWEVQSEAFADSPAWGIIKKAKSWKADLILVGAHGMTSAGRMLLGSISQIVATQASCTVRVVHNRAEDLRSPPRIVIGIDGSPCANTALKEAASRAWPKGTAFHLITAIDPRVKTSVLLPPSQKWLEGNDSVAHYWVGRLMEAAADKLRSRGFAVTCLKKEGDPKKILVEEAERWGADVIFIGARGLGGVKHALMGSVSSAVAARAHCVVEIVRESVPGANAKKKTTKGKVAAV